METWVVVVTLLAVAVSFMISASAGLGGSLILVPTLALVLGTKEGVALSALLLAANNVVKVIAY
ncbi:MAG: sulfite exporter TauE/SafE family protein, partial [Acidimicrobiia bacterium]